jgi:CrcB protein
LNDFFWISFGAIIGANMRYWVNRLALNYLSPTLPYGTLIINITGSFIIGFFLAWTIERVIIDPKWRLFIAIGFCGSYTTFSSYSYETFKLLEEGSYAFGAMNFIFNNLFSLLATVAGIMIARAI